MKALWNVIRGGATVIAAFAATGIEYVRGHPAEDKAFFGAFAMELVWAVIVAKLWGFWPLMLLLSAYICPFVWIGLLFLLDHRSPSKPGASQ